MRGQEVMYLLLPLFNKMFTFTQVTFMYNTRICRLCFPVVYRHLNASCVGLQTAIPPTAEMAPETFNNSFRKSFPLPIHRCTWRDRTNLLLFRSDFFQRLVMNALGRSLLTRVRTHSWALHFDLVDSYRRARGLASFPL